MQIAAIDARGPDFRKIDAFRHGGRWWSAREDAALRAHYPLASWERLHAMLPSRTRSAIHQRAGVLGIARAVGHKPAWRGNEDLALRRLYATATWDELMRALPRHTRGAIAQRATGLKIRRPKTARQSPIPIIRRLSAVRRERRIAIADLAEIIGVHKVQLLRWETGHNVPRLRALVDWAQALEFDVGLFPTAA